MAGGSVRRQANTPTSTVVRRLAVMFAKLSTASIGTNDNSNGSLKALHIPVDGDIYKRIVKN